MGIFAVEGRRYSPSTRHVRQAVELTKAESLSQLPHQAELTLLADELLIVAIKCR